MSFNQIIEDAYLVTFVKQHFGADASDVTRASNNKNLHPVKRFARDYELSIHSGTG
jgi:hypothetical protein